jgi:hypothetical protein
MKFKGVSLAIFAFVCIVLLLRCNVAKQKSSANSSNYLVNNYKYQHLLELYKKTAKVRTDSSMFENNPDAEVFSIDTLTKAIRKAQIKRSIYQDDDRKDWFEIDDQKILKSCNSACAIVNKSHIKPNADGTYSLINPGTLQDSYNLCSSVRYFVQPLIADCTGFAISKRMIATAGHCIDSGNLSEYFFVFDFKMINASDANLKIPAANVFKGIQVLDPNMNNALDFAVILIDRPVAADRISTIRQSGTLSDGHLLYAIGYPLGLPLKYSYNALIRSNDDANYFNSNLDVFEGNSGSPVYDSETNVVEGILVKGAVDLRNNGSCKIYKVCPDYGCLGETVSRISQLLVTYNKYKNRY